MTRRLGYRSCGHCNVLVRASLVTDVEPCNRSEASLPGFRSFVGRGEGSEVLARLRETLLVASGGLRQLRDERRVAKNVDLVVPYILDRQKNSRGVKMSFGDFHTSVGLRGTYSVSRIL